MGVEGALLVGEGCEEIMSAEVKSGETLTTQLRVSHSQASYYLGRGIEVSLDGEELKTLKAGLAFTMKIEPGHHRLRADNTFQSKTVEFDVQPGEQVQYRTWNRKGFGSWMIEILGAGPLYLVLERVDPIELPTPPSPATP